MSSSFGGVATPRHKYMPTDGIAHYSTDLIKLRPRLVDGLNRQQKKDHLSQKDAFFETTRFYYFVRLTLSNSTNKETVTRP